MEEGEIGSGLLGPADEDGAKRWSQEWARSLVCALPDGRGAALLAGLTGMDLDGLLNGAARRVFTLSVAEVRAAGVA